MDERKDKKGIKELSSFSILLIAGVFMIVGLVVAPFLNLRYYPSSDETTITVSYSWPDASSKIIEQEVTAKLERLINGIRGIESIESVSRKGKGEIKVTLKTNVDTDYIRFEIGTIIRRFYPSLPDECTYPVITYSKSGSHDAPILTYSINSKLPPHELVNYTESHIVKPLYRLHGIGAVTTSGIGEEAIEIRYDPEKLHFFGLSVETIKSSVSHAITPGSSVGVFENEDNKTETIIYASDRTAEELVSLPVGKSNGRIVYLGEIATIAQVEVAPSEYFRINGLHTLTIRIFPDRYVNTLKLGKTIEAYMQELQESQNASQVSWSVTENNFNSIEKELQKIFLRIGLAVLILMAFIYLIGRNIKYVLIVFFTLLANLLLSCIVYYLFNIELNLYSLSGQTVSLGLIMDAAIIMLDHYGRRKDKKIFPAILAAAFTTITALLIILYIAPEEMEYLIGFSWIIIINLIISIFIVWLFVPALLEKLKFKASFYQPGYTQKRKIIKFNRVFYRYISWTGKRKWFVIAACILLFGLPINLLPEEIKQEADEETKFTRLYNRTLGTERFEKKIKPQLETFLGGRIVPFIHHLKSGKFIMPGQRQELSIYASLPEGSTVHQLNDIMIQMENYLSQFEEIEIFKTTITDYNNGQITVLFKKEYENTRLPLLVKSQVIAKALNFGGANWSVSGFDDNGFSNAVITDFKSYRIPITGYNYEALYDHALRLQNQLSKHRRVDDPGIYGNVGWQNQLALNEYVTEFEPCTLALNELTIRETYRELSLLLHNQRIGTLTSNHKTIPLFLRSDRQGSYDLWDLKHEMIRTGDKNILFGSFLNIEKKKTGNDIYRFNQQYRLYVAFNFTGTWEVAQDLIEDEVESFNKTLPMGFKAYSGSGTKKKSSELGIGWLVFIIMTTIFIFCAIIFESLSQPLYVILIIPISIIGVFITFLWTGYHFDHGGLAAIVFLSAIAVNAVIYLTNEYNQIQARQKNNHDSTLIFMKAFHNKIVPVCLTTVSTIFSLLPFLFIGDKENFWFTFSLAIIGGLVFSLVAFIFILPILFYKKS